MPRGRPPKDELKERIGDAMLLSQVDHLMRKHGLTVRGACRVIASQRKNYVPISLIALRQRYYRALRRQLAR